MQSWKTISKKILCEPNRFLTLELHEVELPDGSRIDDWPWVVTPDYAVAVVQTEDGRFLCFRQTKYGVDGLTMATVGGFMDPNEDRLAAVKRELLEETGYVATEWHDLGTYVADPNRGVGKANLFLARNARAVGQRGVGDLEEQELILLTRVELEQALDSFQFKALAWVAVVSMALRRLDLMTAVGEG